MGCLSTLCRLPIYTEGAGSGCREPPASAGRLLGYLRQPHIERLFPHGGTSRRNPTASALQQLPYPAGSQGRLPAWASPLECHQEAT